MAGRDVLKLVDEQHVGAQPASGIGRLKRGANEQLRTVGKLSVMACGRRLLRPNNSRPMNGLSTVAGISRELLNVLACSSRGQTNNIWTPGSFTAL
jgi:hypothetical protein